MITNGVQHSWTEKKKCLPLSSSWNHSIFLIKLFAHVCFDKTLLKLSLLPAPSANAPTNLAHKTGLMNHKQIFTHRPEHAQLWALLQPSVYPAILHPELYWMWCGGLLLEVAKAKHVSLVWLWVPLVENEHWIHSTNLQKRSFPLLTESWVSSLACLIISALSIFVCLSIQVEYVCWVFSIGSQIVCTL